VNPGEPPKPGAPGIPLEPGVPAQENSHVLLYMSLYTQMY